MVDITKEEFWENKYEEVNKKEKKNNIVKEFIIKHKLITILLISLSILMITNIVLIYNFFRIFINISVFGMVKDNKHNTDKLIDENKKEIELSQTLMNFITNMQDEVHRIAIGYNRKLRDNDTTKSKLDKINGIGDKKKQELHKKFGSIEGIKKADILEISEVKGITEELAKKIKKELI